MKQRERTFETSHEHAAGRLGLASFALRCAGASEDRLSPASRPPRTGFTISR